MTMWDQLGGATAPYASVGRRIGTWFLDGVVSGLVLVFFGFAPMMLTQKAGLLALGYLAALVLSVVQWWLLGTRGYTIGKALLGTRVVDADTGAPLGMARAFLRLLVLGLLSSCALLLIIVAVLVGKDPRRQGWHDKAARSVEVEAGGEVRAGASAAPSAEVRTPLPPPPFPGAPTQPADSAAIGSTPPGAAPTASAPVTPPPFPAYSAPVAPPPPAPLPAGGLVAPPPGLVTPPPRPTPEPPSGVVPPAPPAPAAPGIDEATRRPVGEGAGAARPVPHSWVLRPRVGTELALAGTTVIGRDPDTSRHPFAVAWRVEDPVFTVSKTHAVVTLSSGTPWIEDLDSTHGVVIRRGGDEMTIDTRTPTRLLAGDVVVLGAFEITVEAG